MNSIIEPEKKTPRDILLPHKVNKPFKKSSSHPAHEFSVTGNRSSIHMREAKDRLFEANELLQNKREDQNQSEFWIG